MKGKRLAIIDLGSNTFHLLVVEITSRTSWTALHKDRRYVKLASGGITVIEESSLERAIHVMNEFAEQISSFEVSRTIAIGTAALREANNGVAAIQRMETASGIRIEVIDGMQEADYIFKGIYSCMPPIDRPGLIMDIGGGSVEFILYKDTQILFVGSYSIGVAVLFKRFHTSDPIPAENIAALEDFLHDELEELKRVLEGTGPYYLVGASGSFEVIRDVLPKLQEGDHWAELDMTGLESYLDDIIQLDYIKRRVRAEIPQERLDYIVVAYLLIRYLIRHFPPKRLYYSDYALKEGIIMSALAKI